MSGYNKGQNSEKALKEAQFALHRLQNVSENIEQLLKDIKGLFSQMQENATKHERVRNLWLGQLKKNGRSQTFLNVAAPVVPLAPTPAPAVPVPLDPTESERRRLVKSIRDRVAVIRDLQQKIEEKFRSFLRASLAVLEAEEIESPTVLRIAIEIRDNVLGEIFLLLRDLDREQRALAIDFFELVDITGI